MPIPWKKTIPAEKQTKSTRRRAHLHVVSTADANKRARPWGRGQRLFIRRIGAELLNRAIALTLIWPILAIPLWMAGASQYVLSYCLITVFLWHLFCDEASGVPSPGKRLCGLRVVRADGKHCFPGQKALRRLIPCLNLLLYQLVITQIFDQSIAAQQARHLADILSPRLSLIQGNTGSTAMLMAVALAGDCLSLFAIAVSADGKRLEDWLAGTMVITKKAWDEATSPKK